jgi:hypothetical protein
MKKIIGLFSLIALFTAIACSNDKPAEVKKEVIVVQSPPAPVVKAPEKNTTVVVDKNGVKVGTKNVDVTVNPEKKK